MANPDLTVSVTNYDQGGYVRLLWSNATKGANWYSWRLYRRSSTPSGKWILVKEFLYDTPSYVYDDYLSPANVNQEYIVVRVHVVSAVPTEEAKTSPEIVLPTSENFWLIHPYNQAFSMMLRQVTGDSWSLEADVATMNVLNRGRRIDAGDVWGRAGSITCQVRGATAAYQLDTLEAQQRARSFYWLRNPFKDMARVAISALSVTRIPGVGLNEYADVTFSYSEIVK